MSILIVEGNNPEREFTFDLEHMLSLTTAERYRWMLDRSREAVERMTRNGYIQTPNIIKRPAGRIRHHRGQRVPKSRVHAPHR
jgi:hypothetical protein